jgi:hypothetical protein
VASPIIYNSKNKISVISQQYLINKLYNDKLQYIPKAVHVVEARGEVAERTLLVGVQQHEESIAFARHVLLAFEEVGYQLRRIRNEELEVPNEGILI